MEEPVSDEVVSGEESEEELDWPIGFMVIVGLAAVYLLWRLVQMVGMLF